MARRAFGGAQETKLLALLYSRELSQIRGLEMEKLEAWPGWPAAEHLPWFFSTQRLAVGILPSQMPPHRPGVEKGILEMLPLPPPHPWLSRLKGTETHSRTDGGRIIDAIHMVITELINCLLCTQC